MLLDRSSCLQKISMQNANKKRISIHNIFNRNNKEKEEKANIAFKGKNKKDYFVKTSKNSKESSSNTHLALQQPPIPKNIPTSALYAQLQANQNGELAKPPQGLLHSGSAKEKISSCDLGSLKTQRADLSKISNEEKNYLKFMTDIFQSDIRGHLNYEGTKYPILSFGVTAEIYGDFPTETRIAMWTGFHIVRTSLGLAATAYDTIVGLKNSAKFTEIIKSIESRITESDLEYIQRLPPERQYIKSKNTSPKGVKAVNAPKKYKFVYRPLYNQYKYLNNLDSQGALLPWQKTELEIIKELIVLRELEKKNGWRNVVKNTITSLPTGLANAGYSTYLALGGYATAAAPVLGVTDFVDTAIQITIDTINYGKDSNLRKVSKNSGELVAKIKGAIINHEKDFREAVQGICAGKQPKQNIIWQKNHPEIDQIINQILNNAYQGFIHFQNSGIKIAKPEDIYELIDEDLEKIIKERAKDNLKNEHTYRSLFNTENLERRKDKQNLVNQFIGDRIMTVIKAAEKNKTLDLLHLVSRKEFNSAMIFDWRDENGFCWRNVEMQSFYKLYLNLTGLLSAKHIRKSEKKLREIIREYKECVDRERITGISTKEKKQIIDNKLRKVISND